VFLQPPGHGSRVANTGPYQVIFSFTA